MKKLIFLIPLIMLMILLSSCEGIFNSDDGPKLPKVTNTGANTFGCKVNGEVWTPSWGAFCVSEGDELYARYGKYIYYITAESCSGQPGGILGFVFFNYYSENKIDSVRLSIIPRNRENNTNFPSIIKTFKGNDLDVFDFNIITGNNIDILHGTFEFDLVDTNRNVTYEIREGRLDVSFEK